MENWNKHDAAGIAALGRACSVGVRLTRCWSKMDSNHRPLEWWSDHAERRLIQKEYAAGRTRPPCAGHPPRARADRTTGCARRTDASGSGKTFINSALAYTGKDCRIARFAGLVAGPSIGAIIAATGRKTALSVSPPSGRRSGGANQEELARLQAITKSAAKKVNQSGLEPLPSQRHR